MPTYSNYFLHSRIGNSFYFKHKDHPDEITCSFTITYIDDGFTVLTGDMGTLTWCRYRGLDYGFPSKDTNIGYFAEKVCSDTLTWSHEKAIDDIKEYIDDLKEEEEPELETIELVKNLEFMLEYETWEDNPIVGKVEMLNNLDEISDSISWYEHGFGDIFDPEFVRKFEMVKSVSDIVLDAVKEA